MLMHLHQVTVVYLETVSGPEGKPGDLFFTGSKNFIVDDYEVFELY